MMIYLAGPIRGLSYRGATDWRNEIADTLFAMGHLPVDPMRGKDFLRRKMVITGAYEDHPLASAKGIYGRDLFDVDSCDILFANLLGTKEVSIGTVMEIQRGHDRGRYVLVIMEEGNIHDHPFVQEAASLVVGSLEDALRVVEKLGRPYATRPEVCEVGPEGEED